MRSLQSLAAKPAVTLALIAASVALFVPSLAGGPDLTRQGNPLAEDFALFGPAVGAGEWWRLLTSGFLHYGLVHLGFNMVILFQLGSMLEPALGRVRFTCLYFTALLAGSFGALLLQPDALTAGASGAVYGLMGAAVLGMRRRGVDPMQSGLGGLLAINLFLTVVLPGISIGGHLGGLAGGAAAGALLFAGEGAARRRSALALAGCLAIGAAAAAGSLAMTSPPV